MRPASPISLIARVGAVVGFAMLAACGSEQDAAPTLAVVVERSGEESGPMANVSEAGAADVAFALGCRAPFTRDATPATLAAAFGRENVVPETIDGPEGQPLNVTAIFPNDPDRRIEVTFANEEERTDLVSVTVRDHASLWRGAGGIAFGDGIAKVEAANGAAFKVSGFEWDLGGYVLDWNGGKLAGASGCQPVVRFAPEALDISPAIMGSEVSPLSSDPAVRAAQPTVALFGISWSN